MKNILLKYIARCSLSIIYSVSIIWSKLFKQIVTSNKQHRRIIINATFHNPNWFFAHIAPITLSGYGEVILITDEPMAQLPGLSYLCPPRWAALVFTRAGAKAIWTFYAGIKYPADFFIGYHIFPSSVTALLCARIFGARAIYQVTYGEAELAGGGWQAENALLRALGSPSEHVQSLALKMAFQFDLVIVRGSNARHFLERSGCNTRIEVVTGSVETHEDNTQPNRDIDIIFVARMAESKRPLFLVEVVEALVTRFPNIHAWLVGDGEQLEIIKRKVKDSSLEQNIELPGKRKDVMKLLARSKIFVLPSRWEGVSIALMEAMISGAVPLVSDVGDMADFVKNGETGFIFKLEDSVESYAEKIGLLLTNETYLREIQNNAVAFVTSRSERKVVTQRWLNIFSGYFENK